VRTGVSIVVLVPYHDLLLFTHRFGRGLLVLYNWMLFLLVILELIAAGMLLAATGTLVRTNVFVPCATMPMLSMIDVTWAQNNSEYGAAAQGKIQQWINQ
jgi:hypothetical protein